MYRITTPLGVVECDTIEELEALMNRQRQSDSTQDWEHFRPFARLTEGAVRDARRRVATGETMTSVARSLGVHTSTVSRAVNGSTWGWLQ